MRMISLVLILGIFFGAGLYPAYAQDYVTSATKKRGETKTLDTNNDGKTDITYHHDGEYVTKALADTNFDGSDDVTVHIKEGKFHSAEVDTDYDGTSDRQFNDVGEFNQWLNESRRQFSDDLGCPDWRVNYFKF